MQRLARPFLTTVAVGIALLGLGSPAQARTDVHFSIGIGLPPVYVQPAPIYVAPAPVYAYPRRIYVEPAPVYPHPPRYRDEYYSYDEEREWRRQQRRLNHWRHHHHEWGY